MNIKRGEIFIPALDPVIGHEVAKTRPIIIVSNNIGNTIFWDCDYNTGYL